MLAWRCRAEAFTLWLAYRCLDAAGDNLALVLLFLPFSTHFPIMSLPSEDEGDNSSQESEFSITAHVLVQAMPKYLVSTDDALCWLRKFMKHYVCIDFAHTFPVDVLKYLEPICGRHRGRWQGPQKGCAGSGHLGLRMLLCAGFYHYRVV